MTIYYRAEIHSEYEHDYAPPVFRSIYYRTFHVVRRTPKGAWVSEGMGHKARFILDKADKRYCYPDKEKAIRSLKRRQQRRLQYLNRDFSIATTTLAAIEEYEKTGEWKEPPIGLWHVESAEE